MKTLDLSDSGPFLGIFIQRRKLKRKRRRRRRRRRRKNRKRRKERRNEDSGPIGLWTFSGNFFVIIIVRMRRRSTILTILE